MVYIFWTCDNDMFEYIFGSLEEQSQVIMYPPSIEGNKVVRKIAHILWKCGIFIKWDFFGKEFNEFLTNIKSDDKVILFACFPEPVLNIVPWLRNKKNTAIWLWDTLAGRPFFLKKIDVVKRLNIPVCTFDPKDAKDYQIKYVPQVYNIKYPKSLVESNAVIDVCDCYYIGHIATEYRKKLLEKVERIFEEQGISFFKYIPDGENRKFLSYSQNLDNLTKCKAILELNVEGQVGPTLRTMEALCYKKKLITDNIHIRDYDFYRKENIFFIGEDDPSRLKSFLTSAYIDVPNEIIMNYDVNTWIKKVFG